MLSLLEENAKPTSQEIEDNFDGNICRCTGILFTGIIGKGFDKLFHFNYRV